MSVRVSTWVWHETTAKGSDLLVLLALADIADEDGVCFPKVRQLAAKCRLDRATVLRRLSVLEGSELVFRLQRSGQSTMYRLPVPWSPDGGPEWVAASEGGSQIATPEGVARVRRGGRTGATGVSHGRDHKDTSLDVTNTSGGASRSKRKPETSLPADWKPKSKHVELASKWDLDLSSEAFRFRAHAEANDRRMRDWDAAFAMWLSKAREHARKNGPSPKRRGNVPEGW